MRNILYILIIFFLFSCNKDDEKNILSIDFSYFPHNIGNTYVYDVTEINIDKRASVNDTNNYRLKETFESSFIDDEKNICYRVERYKMDSKDTLWSVLNIWYITISNNCVYKTEDNYRYKKIIFPVKQQNTWNGNSENTKEFQEYTITTVDVLETIGDKNYNNILSILQNDKENLIEKQYSIEKYAKNIGLVYKKHIDISELEPQPGIPWEQRINVGHIYIQILK